ncbi:hypothetical protein ACFVXK_33275, partial [Streptomyces sp. NPDC058157]
YQPGPGGADAVTVRLADGSVTAYAAPPDRARDLYARFDALLRGAGAAPRPPQQLPGQPQPWQGHDPHHPYQPPQPHPYQGHPHP